MIFSIYSFLQRKISESFIKAGRYRVTTYIALVIAFYLSLSVMDSIWEFKGLHEFRSYIHRLADAMFFALPAWGIRRKKWLFPYICVVTLYLLANVWYYRNYGTIMPLTSFLLVQNLSTIGNSVLFSIRWIDLLLILPPLVFMIGYRYNQIIQRKNHRGGELFKKQKLAAVLCLITLSIIIGQDYVFARCYAVHQHPIYRYKTEPMVGMREYGIVNFWISQFTLLKGCTKEEIKDAGRFIEISKQRRADTQLVTSHNKNLIIILTESLCAWPINLTIDGTEVTPYLNSLTRDTSVLSFMKVLPQIKDGRSSDAQLLINTGLLPLNSGATSVIYGSSNTYPSLPKALKKKGYVSIILTCDNKTVWNQEAAARNYGFDRFYERMDNGHMRPESDYYLFTNSLPILQKLHQPFYAQLVTFSGHDPIETEFESSLRQADIPNRKVMNYLIITQYVDHCIQEFITSLRDAGLYDNSIIVIVGDHDSIISRNLYEGRPERSLEDRFIPLFILNAPLKAETDKVIAQSDIYPSLLDLMGLADYPFPGLGESIFRNSCNCAVNWDGKWVGDNTDDSVRQARFEMWRISDILLRSNFFEGKEF